MVVAAITIAIINFIAYVIFRSVNRWLAYLHLFLLFIFAFIISSRDFSVFYLLIFIIAVLISEFIPQVKTEEGSFSDGKFSAGSFQFILLSLAIGLVMFISIVAIESRVGGNIIGTPNLAISGTSEIVQVWKPTFESMLGIIENFMFFVVMDMLLTFGVLIPLIGRIIQFTSPMMPILIAAFLAGILHIVAFEVSVALILWATIAFAMFMFSRFFTQDSLAADFAHWLKNLMVSVSRGLQIVN